MQGYNAQAAVTTGQIIVAGRSLQAAGDYGRLEPIADAALRDLARAGITDRPATIVADAGYWRTEQMQRLMADGIRVLISPLSGLRAGARPGRDGGLHEFMRRVLAAEHGRKLYSKRKQSIEPTFGQIKGNRRLDRFLRSGSVAVRSDWRLIAASHNLLKLHNHANQPVTG